MSKNYIRIGRMGVRQINNIFFQGGVGKPGCAFSHRRWRTLFRRRSGCFAATSHPGPARATGAALRRSRRNSSDRGPACVAPPPRSLRLRIRVLLPPGGCGGGRTGVGASGPRGFHAALLNSALDGLWTARDLARPGFPSGKFQRET